MLPLCRCTNTISAAHLLCLCHPKASRFCNIAIASISVDRSYPGSFVSAHGILVPNALDACEVKQGSDEWHVLRHSRLTASSFSTALGFWGLDRRVELWEEKIGLRERFAGNPATEWGSSQEASAVEQYRKLTGNVVQSFGFKIYKEGDDVQGWLGASPDGLLDEGMWGVFEKGGVLEVKCPHNKGRPDLCEPWRAVPYYYMPQVQGLMEILDRDWLHLYVWTLNGSTIFRVERNEQYWALIYGVLSDFWWATVVPAKLSQSLQRKVDVNIYRPAGLHRMTSFIIQESRALAMKAPLVWKDQETRTKP